MKTFLIVLFSFLGIQVFAQGKQTPEITTREVKTGRAILLKDNNTGGFYGEEKDSAGILLFAHIYKASQNDQIADDELTEMLFFNIQPDKTGKFQLNSPEQLQRAQAHFYRGCFCLNRGTHLIQSGTIRGAKMSKTTWYINADVMVNVKNGDSHELVNKKIKGYYKIIPQH
jgi:hypothetical protein